MLSEPQTVTINAVAQTLPRTGQGITNGTFTKDDGNVKLSVSHSYGNTRIRRQIRLDYRKIAADPLTPTNNISLSMSVYVVVDTPKTGFTVAEQKQITDAFSAWLTASSAANVVKVLGGES